MAISSGRVFKWYRREKKYLGLKINENKIKKFETPPGQHGSKASQRLSNYARQLREKQSIKRMYGLREKQFHNYYKEASRKKGSTGVLLLEILESRLDNVVYRAGFAATRPEARQLVSHGAILVNGKKVNIPSYRLLPQFKISLSEKAKQQSRIERSLELLQQRAMIDWIKTNISDKLAIYMRPPERDELPPTILEQLVVELYSK